MNTEVTGWRRWIPTDKWVAAFFTGASPIIATWINSGAFDQEERQMLSVLIPALIGAYFVTNKDRLRKSTE